jgi:hypothetical protein
MAARRASGAAGPRGRGGLPSHGSGTARRGVRRRAVPREEGEQVFAAGVDEEQEARQQGVGNPVADARGHACCAAHCGELLHLLAQRDDAWTDGAPLHEQSDPRL